jgi:hypothetical protein
LLEFFERDFIGSQELADCFGKDVLLFFVELAFALVFDGVFPFFLEFRIEGENAFEPNGFSLDFL